MTSAHHDKFGFLLPDMKPWLVDVASGIFFHAAELAWVIQLTSESRLCDDGKQRKFPVDERDLRSRHNKE
jgi:hypothetical protein